MKKGSKKVLVGYFVSAETVAYSIKYVKPANEEIHGNPLFIQENCKIGIIVDNVFVMLTTLDDYKNRKDYINSMFNKVFNEKALKLVEQTKKAFNEGIKK